MLITNQYLKKFSPLPLNYNLDEVNNYVGVAELIWIRPIIGDDFYDELCTQVEEDSLTEANQTLFLEALYPYLAYAVCLEALPFIWADMNEKGITLNKSENSESVTLKDMTYLEGHLRRQVEARKDFFINYLDTHIESFPMYDEFKHCGCNGGTDGCCSNAKLNKPNPMYRVWSTKRINTSLR